MVTGSVDVGAGIAAPGGCGVRLFRVLLGAWAVSASDIKGSLGVSDGSFGLLMSVALLAAAATNALVGSLAERWGTQTGLSRSLAG
jgi:hypothetical protein